MVAKSSRRCAVAIGEAHAFATVEDIDVLDGSKPRACMVDRCLRYVPLFNFRKISWRRHWPRHSGASLQDRDHDACVIGGAVTAGALRSLIVVNHRVLLQMQERAGHFQPVGYEHSAHGIGD